MESVSQGIKAVSETLEPLILESNKTPTPLAPNSDDSENAVALRKHVALMTEWEAVQKEIQVLREELKEDKWLTVFRTVTEQADGMMASLEKAVNRCQVRNTTLSVLSQVAHLRVRWFSRSSSIKYRSMV